MANGGPFTVACNGKMGSPRPGTTGRGAGGEGMRIRSALAARSTRAPPHPDAAAGLLRLVGYVLQSITRLIRQYDLRHWHEDVRVLRDSAVVSPVKRRADGPAWLPNRSLRHGETTAPPPHDQGICSLKWRIPVWSWKRFRSISRRRFQMTRRLNPPYAAPW